MNPKRKKPVYCTGCGHQHLLNERNITGADYETSCPKCGGYYIVPTKYQLQKFEKVVK